MTREFRLLFAAITWLIAGCAAPPPEPPDGSVMQACVPGETRGCACAGGRMGAQACNAAGSGYDACAGCESPVQCGDGRCDSTETCSSCARDCGACAARCGDGTCNGTETCSTCVIDCGRCMTTPRCGDGTCNGTETCSTCPDDCGVCPPRCGDGACNGCGDLRNLHVRLLRSMRNNVHVLLARHRLPERAVLRCATVRWGEGLLRQHDDGLRQHRRDTMPCDVCVQSVPERHGVWPLRRMQALRRRTPDLLAPMLYQCRLPSSAR
jgi:hypothetical protein